ncbi:MAG: glycosyltransferase [Cyanobacteriota bacterium]|nr:glycosyltransferase [Cyanobacteriota bacterium]
MDASERMKLSVAIPTYGRDRVLIESIHALLSLSPPPWELLIVDQTPVHEPESQGRLESWDREGRIRWLRLERPSITAAMNVALMEARGDRVLFLDDDINPDPQLLAAHQRAGEEHPEAMVAGRVLQPWHGGQSDPEGSPFFFNSLAPRWVQTFMGGNVAIPRQSALALGGFDENFVKVAYHFEAEFAHRWCTDEQTILYEPKALIHHLRADRGGTRTFGKHLTTAKPDHSVGRYYFLLRTIPARSVMIASLGAMLRCVRTRHHLSHPWWIPVTLLGEIRGLLWALRLNGSGAAYLPTRTPRLLIVGSHPVQYHTPLFRCLASDPCLKSTVLYHSLPDEKTQGLGFGVDFTWDVPLLEGYRWRQAPSGRGKGITSGYLGVWLANPLADLGCALPGERPDAVLLTGWHFFSMVQSHWAARWLRIPILLRMDSNGARPRSRPLRWVYRRLFQGVAIGLPVGSANARWYHSHGLGDGRLIGSPHFVDNDLFAHQADQQRKQRSALRAQWDVPTDAYCFLFAGKLQDKKRPLDLLAAMERLVARGDAASLRIHLLIVGTGHLEDECRRRVAEHQLPVSFAGFLNQSEIAAAYAVSDCLVLPSDHGETWGLVVNEAMACGLPAVVSDLVGCAEDMVMHGHTGLRFACGDIEGLERGMRTMAADPATSKRMGEAARSRVQELFTIEAAAAGIREATLRVYQRKRDGNGNRGHGRGQIPSARKEAGQAVMTPNIGHPP